jgi:DNA-binding NarL/FixJ family response regulator
MKLIVADDHQLFLDGILSLLKTEKNFSISTANNGQEVLDLLALENYDICILDINMPRLNGIETARIIKEKKIQTKLIVLTTHSDNEFISEMLLCDVAGYLLKNATKQELIKAIHEVLDGKKYFSSEVHQNIMDKYLGKIKTEKSSPASPLIVLTSRETEIVKLLAKEYTNENIAGTLNISYRTVETHRKNIMQKTKAQNLAGLIRYAYENGIIR